MSDLPLLNQGSPWPYIATSYDPGALIALYPFDDMEINDLTHKYWNMIALDVAINMAFTRSFTISPPGDASTTTCIISGPSYSYAALLNVIDPSLTLIQRYSKAPALALTDYGQGEPPTPLFKWPLSYSITPSPDDGSGTSGELDTYPVFNFTMGGLVIVLPTGKYTTDMRIDGAAGLEPGLEIAGFPVGGLPDVGFSTFQTSPPPLTSGGDPDATDPTSGQSTFGGGIPWGVVGTIKWDDYVGSVYGYSGTYLPSTIPDPDDSAPIVAGSDALVVNIVLKSVYLPSSP